MRKSIAKAEQGLAHMGVIISGGSVVFMMVIEVVNAIGRKVGAPVPNTLHAAEALMITAVFMGIGYVALIEGHTYVMMMTRKWKPSVTRFLDGLNSLIGAAVFSFIMWGAWKTVYESCCKFEMIIGVFRFPIWPFRIFFALGLTLFILQLYINGFKFISEALGRNHAPGRT